HIAVMGMERLVPTPGDLGVMLEILARSAVGQRLSVYTNVVTGPRREGDPDGPDELHVVILDNGRSGVLGDSTSEILACIRCGACLNVCPVYREVSGHAYSDVYSGPMGAVLVPSLCGIEGNEQLPYASTLCGACLEVCPVRIDLPGLLLTLRQSVTDDGDAFRWLGWTMSAYKAAATRPKAWRTALSSGAFVSRASRSGWVGRLPGPGSAWTDSRDLRTPAKEPFHDWWRRNRGS
ncbi:MAG: LUD domain-containing protein, partial [Actinomycetia bacterium]|nr:LUD domain-containing protein [Actinomycetes bacterium]